MALETFPPAVAEQLSSADEVRWFLEPLAGDTPEIRARMLKVAERAAKRLGLEWPLEGIKP